MLYKKYQNIMEFNVEVDDVQYKAKIEDDEMTITEDWGGRTAKRFVCIPMTVFADMIMYFTPLVKEGASIDESA